MDAYPDVDKFIEYCTEMGYDVLISPTEDVESGLLRGSVYIDGKYRSRFAGTKVGGREQDREWPRDNATDAAGTAIPNNEIPIEVLRASYEAAFREIMSPGSLTPDYVASERIKSETVGPLSTTYMDGTMLASDTYPVVSIIDQILAPLLISSGTSSSRLFGQSVRI